MSRSRVEKNATNAAMTAAATRPTRMASQMFGGFTVMSAAAAPYIPRPKNAEWPKDVMPV
jgi:hypothetical protein